MNELAYLTERASDWVRSATGEFSSTSLAKDLSITDPETRDRIMSDLVTLKLCEATGRKALMFRPISTEAPPIDWQHAKEDYFPIALPLGIGEYAGINPRALVLVAGETNGGKSYFSMLMAHANLKQNGGAHDTIHFWNSETTPMAIKANATRIDRTTDAWKGLVVRDRAEDFHQVIDPNGLNIIDYLQIEDDFYLVGKKLKAIFDALQTGVCVVFMQKNKGAAYAIGGAFTLHKPVLALSLNETHGTNVCKIDKLKCPLMYPNKEGSELDFRFNQYGTVDIITDWRYVSKKGREELTKQYERERSLRKENTLEEDF